MLLPFNNLLEIPPSPSLSPSVPDIVLKFNEQRYPKGQIAFSKIVSIQEMRTHDRMSRRIDETSRNPSAGRWVVQTRDTT